MPWKRLRFPVNNLLNPGIHRSQSCPSVGEKRNAIGYLIPHAPDRFQSMEQLRNRQIPDTDSYMKKAASCGSGLRILRQEPWEMLITFIISQQRTIPSIKWPLSAIFCKSKSSVIFIFIETYPFVFLCTNFIVT